MSSTHDLFFGKANMRCENFEVKNFSQSNTNLIELRLLDSSSGEDKCVVCLVRDGRKMRQLSYE